MKRIVLLVLLVAGLVLATVVLPRTQHTAVRAGGVQPAASTPSTPSTPTHAPREGDPDPVPSTPTHTHTGSDDGVPTTKVDRAWLVAADRFARTWLHTHGVPAKTWRKDVRALCAPDLAAGFANANPRTVPPGKVGQVTPNLAYDTGGGVAKVAIGHGQALLVTVIPAGKGYRVAALDTAQD